MCMYSNGRLYTLSKAHHTLDLIERENQATMDWRFFALPARCDSGRFLGSKAPDDLLGSVAGGAVLGSHLLGLQDLLAALCFDHCPLLFGFLVDDCHFVLHLLGVFSLLLFQLLLQTSKFIWSLAKRLPYLREECCISSTKAIVFCAMAIIEAQASVQRYT